MVRRLVQQQQIWLLQQGFLNLPSLELPAGKRGVRYRHLLPHVRYAAALLSDHLAAIDLLDASYHLEQRGLPLSVAPCDAAALALLYRKRYAVKNRRSAKRNRNFPQTNQCHMPNSLLIHRSAHGKRNLELIP